MNRTYIVETGAPHRAKPLDSADIDARHIAQTYQRCVTVLWQGFQPAAQAARHSVTKGRVVDEANIRSLVLQTTSERTPYTHALPPGNHNDRPNRTLAKPVNAMGDQRAAGKGRQQLGPCAVAP